MALLVAITGMPWTMTNPIQSVGTDLFVHLNDLKVTQSMGQRLLFRHSHLLEKFPCSRCQELLEFLLNPGGVPFGLLKTKSWHQRDWFPMGNQNQNLNQINITSICTVVSTAYKPHLRIGQRLTRLSLTTPTWQLSKVCSHSHSSCDTLGLSLNLTWGSTLGSFSGTWTRIVSTELLSFRYPKYSPLVSRMPLTWWYKIFSWRQKDGKSIWIIWIPHLTYESKTVITLEQHFSESITSWDLISYSTSLHKLPLEKLINTFRAL